MNTVALKSVVGACRVLRRRVVELGQLGLTVWTDLGVAHAEQAGKQIVSLAHKNECTECTVVQRLEAIVSDGKVTPAEIAELKRLSATVADCSERSHDITEIAAT